MKRMEIYLRIADAERSVSVYALDPVAPCCSCDCISMVEVVNVLLAIQAFVVVELFWKCCIVWSLHKVECVDRAHAAMVTTLCGKCMTVRAD